MQSSRWTFQAVGVQYPGYNVLVVDDDAATRSMIADVLDDGFENLNVVVAADGADAIDKIRSGFRPTLVLTDVHMPNMNGLELLEWVRNVHVGTVVIGMSARHRRDDGFDDFLPKPFLVKDLLARVSRWVRVQGRGCMAERDPGPSTGVP